MIAIEPDDPLKLGAPRANPRTHASDGALDLTIAGTRVCIDGLSGALLIRARDLLGCFVAVSPRITPSSHIQIVPRCAPTEGWSVVCGSDEVMVTRRIDELLAYLDWFAVAQGLQASSGVAVYHAAALARDDNTVLLVAESGAGKTTLTLGLMQRGWQPLADDIALVDWQTLAITAFPRCFHVDTATKATVADPSLLIWPAGIEGYARPVHWATGPHQATCIVLVQRDAESESLCHPVLQAEAAGALAAAAIRNQTPSAERVRVAAQLVAAANACVRLRNGHLECALDLIEAAAAQSLPIAHPVAHPEHQGTLAMQNVVSPEDARPSRRLEIETYILPDGSALLYDPRSEAGHPLDVVRALIWDYCDGQFSQNQIAQEIAVLLPNVPNAAAHACAVLEEFAEAGLLADE